ncbi:MAG TPA: hypothetical protein VMT24_01285, partial [Aggregatilineaceae bacterium]|nr:hypothetical protein [Aggregatilineaceae bacterium]
MRHPGTRWERVALLAIVVVGAWLRFQHIGDIEYNIDQVYPVWQAFQTLDAHRLPLVGQGTSVLFANPPLTGYFFVPMIALVRQPLAAYTLTLMLNTLAVWLAYRALRWLVGTRPALAGAALFAVNPWIIEDSRRTWVQSLAPFFVCLIFWALAPVLTGQTRHPRRRTLIAIVGLALFAHTYLLAYALIAPVGLLLALFWRRVPRRPLIVGGAVFAIFMGVYAVGLARQWSDTRRRAEAFSSGNARLSTEALDHALRLVTGWQYAAVRGVDAPAHDAGRRGHLSDLLHAIWTAALVAGVGLAVTSWVHHPHHVGSPRPEDEGPGVRAAPDTGLILLIWFVLPVLMMSCVSRAVHPFYLLLSIPAGHGLAAWGISPLLRRRAPALAVTGLLVFTGVVNGLNTIRFAQNTAAHPGEDLPETLPLAQATALGSRIRAERTPGIGVFSAMDAWTPVTLAGSVFRVEKMSGFDRAAMIPAGGGLYILVTRDPSSPALPPPGAQPAGPPLTLADGTQIALWRAHSQDLTIAHPADIPSDIDVRFAGWTLSGDLVPGQTATLDTVWRVEALHA